MAVSRRLVANQCKKWPIRSKAKKNSYQLGSLVESLVKSPIGILCAEHYDATAVGRRSLVMKNNTGGGWVLWQTANMGPKAAMDERRVRTSPNSSFNATRA